MNLNNPGLLFLDVSGCGSLRACRRLGRAGQVFAWALAILFGIISVWGQRVEPAHGFRFGISSSLMPEVNENDARAAMKVWLGAMIKNGALPEDSDVTLCPDAPTLIASVTNHLVDGLVATTPEFLELQGLARFNHCVFGLVDGTISDEYLLVVPQGSAFKQIEDLRGRSLNLQLHSRTCLAEPWLDTLLVKKGLSPVRQFFGSITAETKLTKVVLPVFFGKADACLVTRKGFKTMTELNPQVGRQLRILAASPEFVATGFYFLASHGDQQRYLDEFTRLHITTSGQQILTVFQTERLSEFPAAVVESAAALLAEHRQLCRSTNLAVAGAPAALRNAQGGGE